MPHFFFFLSSLAWSSSLGEIKTDGSEALLLWEVCAISSSPLEMSEPHWRLNCWTTNGDHCRPECSSKQCFMQQIKLRAPTWAFDLEIEVFSGFAVEKGPAFWTAEASGGYKNTPVGLASADGSFWLNSTNIRLCPHSSISECNTFVAFCLPLAYYEKVYISLA